VRPLQQARVRARPLEDNKLDERFQAALLFGSTLTEWKERPTGVNSYLRKALVNVREGFVAHLKAPRLIPGKHRPAETFPSLDEFKSIMARHRTPDDVILALEAWERDRG
jgi:hypothetical protein